ncbi:MULTISPECIES: hypothetical protein [Novosphingobium]|nr:MULTISPECIES: hypothetical protein [Novosphingobium]CDO37656.1 hypothetical protein SPHV1_370043 [Novosphingobium sp. KN65.2]
MAQSLRSLLSRCLPGPLALQGIVAGLVLIVALSPSEGGAAIYLPFDGSGAARTVAWSRERGAEVVARGPYEGAFILRIPQGHHAMEALRQGALLISVPEFLCGSPDPSKKT